MTSKIIYKTHNSITHKYDIIDLDEAELLPGMTILKLYRDNFTGRYVTVPGASMYQVNNDLQLELVGD